MNDIANDMLLLDAWMREQDIDMGVPDYIKAAPYDAAGEIERLEEIIQDLLEALEYIAEQWPDDFCAKTARAAIARREGRSEP